MTYKENVCQKVTRIFRNCCTYRNVSKVVSSVIKKWEFEEDVRHYFRNFLGVPILFSKFQRFSFFLWEMGRDNENFWDAANYFRKIWEGARIFF